jgi:hypothetical protein
VADHEEERDVSRHNQGPSTTVGAEIAGDRAPARETRLEKRWRLVPKDRAADLLADLVFVMLILLWFVWVGLWTWIH